MDYYYSAGINYLVFVIPAHCGKPGFSEEPRQPQGGGGTKTGRYTAMRKIYKGDSHDMRNFKRFLAMALTMLMIVGSFTLLTSAKFEDVTDFQDEITILSELGVIKGKADGTFGFDEEVTRRQTALFMARATTGKVDDALNWQSKVNNTPFTDLDPENDYYGAISYCHNNGIVKGKDTTVFAPNDSIIFKEALTMAVRALGYKGADMDAGYPWTYYSKAVSLGLDKGLENVAMDEVVTRGYMAKLLYNMMFATNSKGTTMASDSFGTAVKATNLVLAAVPGKKLVANFNPLPSDTSVVALIEFNADGTLNYNKAYNFKWADFAALAYGEGTEEKAIDHVGDSYYVVTINGFKSLVSVTENPSKTFTQDEAPGNGKIDGADYSLVQKWSSVFNIGTTESGKDELIQYNTAHVAGGNPLPGRKAYFANQWYVVNEDNNILGTDGNVLLYYFENIDEEDIVTGAATSFPFYYKIGNLYYPAYLPMDGSRYAGAATLDQLEVKRATYASDKNAAAYTTNVNAYTDTVAYDDNNDGVYDRAYFTAYSFGQYKETDDNGNGFKEYKFTLGAQGKVIKSYGDNNNADVDVVINNISGKELKNNSYILWAHDAVNDSITVKKIFDEIKTGYVTGIDVIKKTITFNTLTSFGLGIGSSETLKYGVAKLPGATNTNDNLTINDDPNTGDYSTESLIGINVDLFGKTVSYVVDDVTGNIIAIAAVGTPESPLVVTSVNFNSLLTYGFVNATVIDASGNSQLITISRINNLPALSYAWGTSFSTEITNVLKNGALIYGVKQDDGTWIVATDEYAGSTLKEYTLKGGELTGSNTVLTFVNGIAYENLGVPNPGVNPKIKTNFAFKADGSNLVVVVGLAGNKYTIAKGIPVNNSTLTIAAAAGKTANLQAKNGFLYIPYVEGVTVTFSSGWNLTTAYETGTASDVIYLKALAPYGVSGFGNTYTYTSNYVSILTGASNGDIGIITSSKPLATGKFYEVTRTYQNGVAVLLVKGDGFDKTDTTKFKKVTITDIADNGVYYTVAGATEFKAGNVLVYNWSDDKGFGDQIKEMGDDVASYDAYYYDGDYVNGDKVYFLVTKANETTITGKAITGITLEVDGASVVNTTVLSGSTLTVSKVSTIVNGEADDLDTTTGFDNVFFRWYTIDSDGKATLATGGYGLNKFTVTDAVIGKKIMVTAMINGYTPAEEAAVNTAKTGEVMPDPTSDPTSTH
jgi:hypothetical protein